MGKIAEKRLNTWRGLHRYSRKGWIFRGQERARWPLTTSLERLYRRESIPVKRKTDVERELIRDFKRAYHQYDMHLPGKESPLEWLALMQHYGAPTRLCDFTYSIYIAAYFALERATGDCAVWAIDAEWASRESKKVLKKKGKTHIELLSRRTYPDQEIIAYRALLSTPYARCAYPTNAFRLNQRLRIQKGVFLVPGNVNISFMENLRYLPDHDEAGCILKIIIPIEKRTQALKELFSMNISRTSLFPGLDGYAQSMAVFHPVLDPWEKSGHAEGPSVPELP
jgi:hypothetical protein